MGDIEAITANILRGGNSAFVARWVFGRRAWLGRQNFLGSDRARARFRGADVVVLSSPGDGSHSFGIGAAHFFESTDFCGFQRVAWFIVARPASHGMGKGTDFSGFAVRCRLTVSYPPSSPVALDQGRAASTARPDRARGVPPFAASFAPDARGGCGGTGFQKRAETGLSILPSQSDLADGREIKFGQMGSGVWTAQGRQNLAEKRGFSGAKVGIPKGVGGKVAGHVPSDVAVAAMLCGAGIHVN